MSNEYDPKEIEPKWLKKWEKEKASEAKDPKFLNIGGKPKWYSLVEFPYPSGDGLHVGHVRSYTALDVVSRKRRMQGYNVLYPIGWDAFGLPTENYALKTGRPPEDITKENTNNFRKQMKALGLSFDWSREVNTTDPKYYKWTQWIFLQFLKHGLAYKAKTKVNWCPKDKIVLANEEVVDGRCERCGTVVEQREKEQWLLKITAYAERLLKDLDEVDYPERVKAQQRNWIGKSEGGLIKFAGENDSIEIFTTRPDTIFGATFLVKAGKTDRFTGEYATNPATKEKIPVWEAEYVMADYGTGAIMGVPAHDERDYEFAKKHDLAVRSVVMPSIIDTVNPPKAGKEFSDRKAAHAVVRNPNTGQILLLQWKQYPWKTLIIGGIEENESAIEAARREVHEETGFKNLKFIKVLGEEVRSQFYAEHKDINRRSYSTAVVFDLVDEERDQVTQEESDKHEWFWGKLEDVHPCAEIEIWKDRFYNNTEIYTGEGILINSNDFVGLATNEAKKKITKSVDGEWVTRYKLRDWIFSRQRYWGEPIPVIHCERCGIVPVPEEDLPVFLPKVENYQPTDTGESPLANVPEWVNVECPKCGGKAKRETDVMPNWAGSSWYFYRYADPHNEQEFASKKALKHWMPVDWYNGGMEHTTLHLLYSRFWNKFLFDQGLVPTSEPYNKRTSHGIILAADARKMSKSFGNVVNPDDIVTRFGADTLRLYEMFMGPFEQAIAWNDDSLVGPRRFLERVWRLQAKIGGTTDEQPMHLAIKKISEDIENLGFNTAVSSLMVWVNSLEKKDKVSEEEYSTLLCLLAPFAPHIAEELWQNLGHNSSIHIEQWPKHDDKKLQKSEVVIVVQVNGRVRGKFTASPGIDEKEAKNRALKLSEIQKWTSGKEVKKEIFVPDKLLNIIIS